MPFMPAFSPRMRIQRTMVSAGTSFAAEAVSKAAVEQSVTCEDRRCFIESLVAGRFAAAQVVVIHARKVIMDERVGMDHLKRTRERQRLLDIAAAQAAEFQHDYRTQALAACHRGVLCSLENAVVTLAGLPPRGISPVQVQ